MWRNIASNALSVFVVLLIALAALIGWGQAQYRGEGPLAEPICMQVPGGSTMRGLSGELAERGAVSNEAIFRIGADYSGKSGDLKAGSFLLPAGASMEQIVDLVTRGGANTCGTEIVLRIGVTASEVQLRELDPVENRFDEIAAFDPAEEEAPEDYIEARSNPDTRYRIAMAEGVTSWQVVSALEAADFLTDDVETVPAEGSLAPFSYEVREGASIAALLKQMQDIQAERLDEAWRNRADGLPVDTIEEALILASIIEKETGVPEERRQVASVFVNRLKQGIRLQTDPTVIYGITKGQGVLGRGLRQSELARETPYNTYVINGLPPTPIANPGLASIEAALDPATTDYLFFVADGTGGHAFAETLAEHNANVAKWREIEAQRDQ